MPNTITSFPTAVAGQKARASDFNDAFSNFRGDRVPINTNTATASDNAHDLGTSEHRWKDIYAHTLRLASLTTTSDFIIVPNAGSTLGDYDFMSGTFTLAAWARGYKIFYDNTTTGHLEYQISGSTICSISNSGLLLAQGVGFYLRHASGDVIQSNNAGLWSMDINGTTVTSANSSQIGIEAGISHLYKHGSGNVQVENNATNFNIVTSGTTIGTFDTDGLQFYSLKSREGGTATEGVGEVALSSNINISAATTTSTAISGSTLTLSLTQKHFVQVAFIPDSGGAGPYATIADSTVFVSLEILNHSGTTIGATKINTNISGSPQNLALIAIDTNLTSSAHYYLKRYASSSASASTITGRLSAYEI